MSERRPKLIATDLDGTIVPHNEGISHRTIAAFTKARDLGIEIFFVTGRPPRWMGDVREAFDFGTAICCNGQADAVSARQVDEETSRMLPTVYALRICQPHPG